MRRRVTLSGCRRSATVLSDGNVTDADCDDDNSAAGIVLLDDSFVCRLHLAKLCSIIDTASSSNMLRCSVVENKHKISNKTIWEKVQRHCTVVDLIKQRNSSFLAMSAEWKWKTTDRSRLCCCDGGRWQTLCKTSKAEVGWYCRLVWMLPPGSGPTSEQRTEVESNHRPQWLTWAMSWRRSSRKSTDKHACFTSF